MDTIILDNSEIETVIIRISEFPESSRKWADITDKPAVIAAGATIQEALEQIGLENVNAEIISLQATKVDKVAGLGLSQENFTTTLKNKLDSITAIFTTALKTAYDNAVTWISTNGANLINHLSATNNPHNVTKTQVGLGSVDDTPDTAKPISTLQATALATKVESTATVGVYPKMGASKTLVDGLISESSGVVNVGGKLISQGLQYGKAINISSLDLDGIVEAGDYSGNNLPNAPSSSFYYITVKTYAFGGGYVKQIARDLLINKTYERTSNDSNWSAWVQLATTENLGDFSTTGLLKFGQFTDGTEPAYFLGATYFNTTINKMKIGGASAWEVVTSV